VLWISFKRINGLSLAIGCLAKQASFDSTTGALHAVGRLNMLLILLVETPGCPLSGELNNNRAFLAQYTLPKRVFKL